MYRCAVRYGYIDDMGHGCDENFGDLLVESLARFIRTEAGVWSSPAPIGSHSPRLGRRQQQQQQQDLTTTTTTTTTITTPSSPGAKGQQSFASPAQETIGESTDIIGEEFPVPSSTGVVETGDPLHIAEESEGNPIVVKPYECSRSGTCSSNVREVDEMGYGATRGISSRSLGDDDDDDSLNAEQELAYLYEARAAAGIVYLLGYSEVHCKQDTFFLKKLLINVYSYLRRNCRTSELYLRIPNSRLLKVGMTYYV
jgi:hypothetical protein